MFGTAKIADAEACNADGTDCAVQFDPEFSASDADGDVLEYSILPVTDHSNLFVLGDPSSLASISYIGQGISQETDVTLLVKVSLVISILHWLITLLLRHRRRGHLMAGVQMPWSR